MSRHHPRVSVDHSCEPPTGGHPRGRTNPRVAPRSCPKERSRRLAETKQVKPARSRHSFVHRTKVGRSVLSPHRALARPSLRPFQQGAMVRKAARSDATTPGGRADCPPSGTMWVQRPYLLPPTGSSNRGGDSRSGPRRRTRTQRTQHRPRAVQSPHQRQLGSQFRRSCARGP